MPCGIRVVTLVTLHAWLVSLAVHPAGAAPAALQMRSADDSTDGRRRSLDQRAREVKAPYPDAVSLLALLLLRRPASSLPSSLNKHTHYPCCCSSLCRQIVRTRTECAQNQTKPFFGLLWGFDRRSGSDRKCEIWRSQDVCARDTSHYEQRTKTVRAEDIAN